MIFVFGSNIAGRHGAGAAKYALDNKGAKYGIGEGLQGNSYGLPTKDKYLRPLTLPAIKLNVDRFVQFAIDNPQLEFEVTRIGCGYAGYNDRQIAPLFKDAPMNCKLPEGWRHES